MKPVHDEQWWVSIHGLKLLGHMNHLGPSQREMQIPLTSSHGLIDLLHEMSQQELLGLEGALRSH